jgi:hypothetical protein
VLGTLVDERHLSGHHDQVEGLLLRRLRADRGVEPADEERLHPTPGRRVLRLFVIEEDEPAAQRTVRVDAHPVRLVVGPEPSDRAAARPVPHELAELARLLDRLGDGHEAREQPAVAPSRPLRRAVEGAVELEDVVGQRPQRLVELLYGLGRRRRVQAVVGVEQPLDQRGDAHATPITPTTL